PRCPEQSPRDKKKVSHTQVLETLEADGAGVQERREARDRRHYVRNDPEGTSDRGDHTRAGATGKASRHRVEDSGTRRDHDDERCQQEGGPKGSSPGEASS